MRVALRLPLIVAVAFLAFAMLTSAILIVAGRKVLADVEIEHLSLDASYYASAIQFYLKSARNVLEVAAQTIDPNSMDTMVRTRSPKGGILNFIASHSSVFEFLMLVKPDGTIVIIEPENFEKNLYRKNIAFKDWFRELHKSGSPVISNLLIAVPTNRPAVIIGIPIFDSNGRIAGALAGSIKLEGISHDGSGALKSTSRGPFGYLTDSHGLVIAHQTKPKYVIEQIDFSSEPTVQAALDGRQGTMSFFDPVEKESMLAAYLPVQLAWIADSHPWAVCFAVPQSAAFAPIGIFSRTIGASAALFSLGFGLLTFILIRRFTRPLDELTRAVQKVAASDFAYRVSTPQQDEFSSLTQAYNTMAAELGEKERRILENEAHLKETNLRLEESNRELEAFSYSVSHDLRAPLRAIDGFSHALLEDYGEALEGQGKDYLERVRHGVQMMGDLIDDMLRLSRVNQVELTRETIDLSALIRGQAEDLVSRDPDRKAEFVIAPGMKVEADRHLVQILTGNLLENAWKFTRKKPRARIECGRFDDHGAAAFFLRDNGVGFDMKYVEKLFSAFQRLHERAEYEGTGIGLVIVKRIANRHGGRAWADAVPGEGATFFFSLSAREAP
jgi:signal transduction histidine kinase